MKQKALLIAEKPSLMRTIQSVYNKHQANIPYDCTFLAQAGHLLTLKLPNEIDSAQEKWSWSNLPFHPENYGGWQYKIISGNGPSSTAKQRFYDIRDEIKNGGYDFIIHAGDPDQEGELLVRIVLDELHCKLPVKRFWSNDVTETKVLEALLNLKDDDNDPMLVNLCKAGYCRQHTDYRYGMNFSEAVSLKMGGRAAIGRVKTWMVARIAEREDAIANFVPSTCYGVKADYQKGFMGQLYDPKDVNENEKDEDKTSGFIYFDTEDEAKEFIKTLHAQAKVESYDVKDTDTYAPKLFKLATLQIAANKLGYSSDDTLNIIQSLYEKGFLSYPRTDCEYLSSNENYIAMIQSAMAVPELIPFIKTISKTTIEKVKHTKKWVNDKELQEHGHSAIVPTTKKPDISTFSKEETDIYTLVCRQFVAIFMPPLKIRKTIVITDISGNKFRSSGKEIIDKGYTTIFGQNLAETKIPNCNLGEILNINGFITDAKTTKCPSHLSDADLIAICEAPHKYLEDPKLKALGKALHIGTPATRSTIIKGLITKDKYLKEVKKGKTTYLVPTQNGYEIYENLKDNEICKTDLTGQWEEKLELIRTGQLDAKEFEKDMIAHVNAILKNIENSNMKSFSNVGTKTSYPTICNCPICGKAVISGPKGFFCSGYKDGCKIGGYKQICESILTNDEIVELLNGKEIEKAIKKDGNSWKQKLKYVLEEGKIEFIKTEYKTKELPYSCPNCSGKLSDKGKLITCDGCKFTLWKEQCGKELSDTDIELLLSKGSTKLIKGFKSKKGTKFNAKIVLKKDKLGTEFKFE